MKKVIKESIEFIRENTLWLIIMSALIILIVEIEGTVLF